MAVAYNGNAWLVNKRSLETDFLALLPMKESDPVVSHAFETITESAQQDVLVLIGSRNWDQARAAAQAYADVVARRPEEFTPRSFNAMATDSALAPWWANRRALLTDDDRRLLHDSGRQVWAERALRELLSPISAGRTGAWQDDPFGTFNRWLRSRTADTPVRPVDGVLRVDDGDMHYAVLSMRLRRPVFAMSTQRVVQPQFVAARDAAMRTAPNIEVLAAGMIFPAAAAAMQASREFSTIGWGSILCIALVVWVTFKSLRPIGLVLLSLAVGTIAALGVTAWLYPQVHLLTLAFGASLIGVAEDYGMHALCVSDRGERGARTVMRESLPGLTLALLTTVVSFLALGVSPFPGLQQIAVFSAVGLVSAWLTVVLWFPTLDGLHVGQPRLVFAFERLRVELTRERRGQLRLVAALAAAVVGAIGLARLHADDDIRLLQSLPADLMSEQTEVGRILRMPFTAQFYVVRAPSEREVLEREEALRRRLDSLIPQGVLSGYQAISTWVPSAATQQRDAAVISERLYDAGGPLDQLRAALGEDSAWANRLRRDILPTTALNVASWHASAISEPMRPLWLGRQGDAWVSVVTLKSADVAQSSRLAAAASSIPGVTWADQVHMISSVLGRYRVRMSWALGMSYVAVWLLFLPRYGRRGWRILAPSVTASLAALAVIGLLGQPMQLFHVLALYLVFGIGVDYAIFLTERTHSHAHDAWFAVGLAAISTILSFGLLALSTTPVLRALGTIMLVGITVSTFAAPIFCSVGAPATTERTP